MHTVSSHAQWLTLLATLYLSGHSFIFLKVGIINGGRGITSANVSVLSGFIKANKAYLSTLNHFLGGESNSES